MNEKKGERTKRTTKTKMKEIEYENNKLVERLFNVNTTIPFAHRRVHTCNAEVNRKRENKRIVEANSKLKEKLKNALVSSSTYSQENFKKPYNPLPMGRLVKNKESMTMEILPRPFCHETIKMKKATNLLLKKNK